MKKVKHRRHRHSEGPGYYRWILVGLATLGLLHLCYLVAGQFFSSLGGALLTIWIILPMVGGLKVGAGGLIRGGMPALVGTLLLAANYGFPYLGYSGADEAPTLPILLIAPAIHWVVIVTISVLLSALSKR